MPHESTVRHEEILPGTSGHMEDSLTGYSRRYSFAQQRNEVGKRSLSNSITEASGSGAVLKSLLECQKSTESSSAEGVAANGGGVNGSLSAGHIRRTYPETPAEFTQTIDVYDDEDSSDANVMSAAKALHDEEGNSSESGDQTPRLQKSGGYTCLCLGRFVQAREFDWLLASLLD